MKLLVDTGNVKKIKQLALPTEELVASTRHPIHIVEAAKMGADSGTCPANAIDQLFQHPLTDIGLANFLKGWEQSQAARV